MTPKAQSLIAGIFGDGGPKPGNSTWQQIPVAYFEGETASVLDGFAELKAQTLVTTDRSRTFEVTQIENGCVRISATEPGWFAMKSAFRNLKQNAV